jgi:hypothetical protein
VKNGEYRLKIVILAALLAFLVLFGSYKLYIIYGLEQPLTNRVEMIQGVELVQVDKSQGRYEFKIKLAQVQDFQNQYRQIDAAIGKKLRPDSYIISIEDNRNTRLDRFYAYAQLAVYQAANDDQYIWLDQTLTNKADSTGINYTLKVDSERIYIQAKDGSSYLYETIPRSTDKNVPEGEKVS